MIGIDTNVLLRLWLDDDPAQTQRIAALFERYAQGEQSILVNDVVLAEAIWVLRSAYAQSTAAQLKALHSLLDEPVYAFEDRAAVELAVTGFASGRTGFSDCLIAARNTTTRCDFTATFATRMRSLTGVRVI